MNDRLGGDVRIHGDQQVIGPAALFVTIALICAPAWASNWRIISVDQEEHSVSEIDVESFAIGSHGSLKAWTRVTYRDARHLSDSNTFKRIVERHHYDCRRHRLAVGVAHFFEDAEQQHSVFTSPEVEEMDWTEVLPDSIGEAELQMVCKAIARPRMKPQGTKGEKV
jgi:hypothetical protein